MLKVLIAEDDLIIADLAEEILVDHGYQVCGIARTVSEAVKLALQHQPDLAVLDLRLADGGLGTEIAAQLRPFGRLGILYATANIAQVTLTDADGTACLSKPYRSADLLRSLEVVIEIVATGATRLPLPHGLQILQRRKPSRLAMLHER